MNGRERCITALSIEEPDRVPTTELDINVPFIKDLTGAEKSWTMVAPPSKEPLEKLLDVYILAYKRLKFDAIFTVTAGMMKPPPSHEEIRDENVWTNEWGTIFKYVPETGATAFVEPFPIKTIEDLEGYVPPDPSDPYQLTVINHVMKKVGEDMLVIVMLMDGGFPYYLMGLQAFLKAFYTNSRLIDKLCEMEMKYSIELGKQIADAGVQAVILGHDLADNHGPFVHPTLLRKFVFPRIRQVVQSLKKRGVFVLKHSDGKIMGLLQDFVDIGIDGVHPLEPHAGNSLEEFKESYGDKLCLVGNIDCTHTLCSGSLEDVKKETQKCIKTMSLGGGHILSSSHSYHHAVKVQNVLEMLKVAHEYGKYPIR